MIKLAFMESIDSRNKESANKQNQGRQLVCK